MNVAFPTARIPFRSASMALCLCLGLHTPGFAQVRQSLEVPKDLFASFCYFNSGVYSVGSTFCSKPGTAIVCKGPDKENTIALWVSKTEESCLGIPAGASMSGH